MLMVMQIIMIVFPFILLHAQPLLLLLFAPQAAVSLSTLLIHPPQYSKMGANSHVIESLEVPSNPHAIGLVCYLI